MSQAAAAAPTQPPPVTYSGHSHHLHLANGEDTVTNLLCGIETASAFTEADALEIVIASPTPNVEDEKQKILEKRLQPLYELVDSERTYVNSLKFVAEKYIPLDREPLPTGPELPSDLVSKWRILWGNWLQLLEWHQTFVDRLENFQNEKAWEDIPKLFIDSKMRLRNNYCKYCGNHRKAVLVAEQYRDFFEELRVRLGDKHDVLSHLMRPVQRIMRYQLPMEAVVKLTERADLPSLPQWKHTLDIMKEIPNDTQLILEAARIDDYPGTITALGKVRIRDELLLATLTPTEAQILRNASFPTSAGTSPPPPHSAPCNTSGTPNSLLPSLAAAAMQSGGAAIVTDAMSSGTATSGATISQLTDLASTQQQGELNSAADAAANCLKFQERRIFLFDQSLLITEEIKPKKVTPFSQSTFQFKSFVNVNKMKFEPHWRVGGRALAGSGGRLNGTGPAGVASTEEEEDLRFVIHDISPGKECTYVIDPCTVTRREAWVVQLRDIQNMQQELLLALQYPKKFAERNNTAGGGDGGGGGGGSFGSAAMAPGMELRSLPAGLSAPLHSRGKSDVGSAGSSGKHSKKNKGSPTTGESGRLRLPNVGSSRKQQRSGSSTNPLPHQSERNLNSLTEGNTLDPATAYSQQQRRKGSCPQSSESGGTTESQPLATLLPGPPVGYDSPGGNDSSGGTVKPDLRKANSNMPHDELFRHHEAPPNSGDGTAPPSGGVKKKPGNIFSNFFAKAHRHHQHHSAPHPPAKASAGTLAQSATASTATSPNE